MHLMVCARGTLRVQAGPRRPWRVAAGVLTAPDQPHAIDASGAEILLVFVDPESAAGVALAAALAEPVRLLDDAERARLAGGDPMAIMGQGGAAWIDGAIAALGGPRAAPRRPATARVRRVVRLLQELPPEADRSLAGLAAAVGWSPGRLMHAFSEEIGIPLRPYVAWLRLQRAAAAIVGGAALADAAFAAGFADAAHMSRTFRRMFGMPPSLLRARTE
jgi:transcriptional regulator GlxA family with amidase domain